jgi:DNA gyrase inhibitor GyrI
VVSDAFPAAAAGAFHANFAPALSVVRPASQPAWYIVRGRAAAGQLAVLGSEPGENDYSPLWRTVYVQWQPGVTPKLLTSDNMILSLAKKGELTATSTHLVVNSTVISVKGRPVSTPSAPMSTLGAHSLPAQSDETLPAFPAYYDAHKDTVVVSDGFPRTAASAFHANFAPSLSVVRPASQPAWYIVRGRAAAGQLAVLGSEPGEKDYSPLWRTVYVQWQPGVAPKVLTSDNMILSLARKGELTVTDTPLIINAAVVAKP